MEIELPYGLAIVLLGICPKNTSVVLRRGPCMPVFKAAMSTITKLWKEPGCPSTDEWIKKVWCVCVCVYIYIYTHNGILLSHPRKSCFAMTGIELEGIMLSEISQSEKDNYHMISLICGI